MKKIISIFISVALIISCFGGIFAVSAEDTETATDALTALTGKDDFLLGVGIPEKDNGDAMAAIEEAKALGSNIVRVGEPDDHDYTYLLSVVKAAEQHGMKVLLVCDHIYYDFLYNSETKLPYATADEVDTAAVTEHYKNLINAVGGRIDYYQLGNELDNKYYVGGEQGRVYDVEKGYYLDVASAVAAITAASEAIKAVDTAAKTVINFNWLHYGFLDGLNDAGFSWDVSGIDWYSSGSYNAEYGVNGTVAQYNYTDVINTLAEKYTDKELIVCETGLSPNGFDENGDITYIGDADWLAGLITDIYNNYSDKVSGIVNFTLYDPEPQTDDTGAVVYDKEDYYGLIDCDGNKKDTYYTVQTLYGGSDDWYVMSGGDVDEIYDTLNKSNNYSCFEHSNMRVSDYAVEVGERMMYYPTDTALNGNIWSLRNGLANGAFTYDGTTFERIYSINAQCKAAVDNGIEYTVAANTELHIPIVVPDGATDILSYFKFRYSTDGETWEDLTANVVQTTSSIQISTSFKSTMTVYSVRLYEDCKFRVLFPRLWYDETMVTNTHDPNGNGESPYDILYNINVGNIYNGAMYMLPATAYGFNALSAGDAEVFTATTEVCWGSICYASNPNAKTTYGEINGIFVQMNSSNISGWIYDDYGSDYSLTGKTYISPTVSSGERYVEFYIAPNTVIEFDIAMWSALWTALTEKKTDFSFEVDEGNGFESIDNSVLTYSLNANETVRTYRFFSKEGSVLRITYPDMNAIGDYVTTNKPANQSSDIIYRGACLLSAPTAKGILADGVSDILSGDETAISEIVTGNAFTISGSDYSVTSSNSVCRSLVNASSTWTWMGITDISACADLDQGYVYTPSSPFNSTANDAITPYIDFYVTEGSKVILPFGMFNEMWEKYPNVKFQIASVAGDDFADISSDDIDVVSESAVMCNYDGTKTDAETDPLTGKWTCTVKTYSIPINKDGILRVYWPATIGEMKTTVTEYYNTDVRFLSRTSAFIVPPTAESIDFGDVNGDGDINILDLIRLKKGMAQVEGVTYDKLAANVDGTTGISSGDMTMIKKFLLGTIKSFK